MSSSSSCSPVIHYSESFYPDAKANFAFPIPNVMETDRVKLVPYEDEIHTATIFSATYSNGTYDYLPIGPFENQAALSEDLRSMVPNPTSFLFAILDKTQLGPDGKPELAGIIGYIHADKQHLCLEVGHLIIFHKFRGSHVASGALGMVVHYALDLPNVNGKGLGLRRVTYCASTMNLGSIRLSERLGFQREGVFRWVRAVPPSKAHAYNGKELRKGDPKASELGRDTVVLSMCWDDWESEGRETTRRQMERQL